MNQATLHAIPKFTPSDDDLAHEREMKLLLVRFRATAGNGRSIQIKRRRQQIWYRYVQLHNSRSPEMVAYLGRQRGSRA